VDLVGKLEENTNWEEQELDRTKVTLAFQL
jgi:hypothetical protein